MADTNEIAEILQTLAALTERVKRMEEVNQRLLMALGMAAKTNTQTSQTSSYSNGNPGW